MKKRPLLICGSGRSLFPDLEEFASMSGADVKTIDQRADIMAINDAFLALPVVHYLASYHSELIWSWLTLRGPLECINGEYKTQWRGVTYSQRPDKGVKQVRVAEHGSGSSSFYGVQITLADDYDRVILCGVPFDMTGRFYEPPWLIGHNYAATDGWEAWEAAKARGDLENVRSMSGNTAELLGTPERQWLWQ